MGNRNYAVASLLFLLLASIVHFTVEPASADDQSGNAIEAWAILLCGGDRTEEPSFFPAQPCFENQVAEAYNTLMQRGYFKDHVYFLDLYSPRDVDNDGSNDVNAVSRKANVEFAFRHWLRDNSDSNDISFIYMVDHGYGLDAGDKLNGTHPFLCYHDETVAELLFPWELGNWLDEITYGNMVVILDACYSGVFISDLSGPNRVIMTSTNDVLGANREWRYLWASNLTYAEPNFVTMWFPIDPFMISFQTIPYTVFSYPFFNTLKEKTTLAQAFNASVLHIFWTLGPGGSNMFWDPPWYGGDWADYIGQPGWTIWEQYPLLDDNNDDLGTGGPMPTSGDGNLAATMCWMPGDCDGDNKIDGNDVAIVASAYNTSCSPKWNLRADVNHDWVVNDADIDIVENAYGSRPGFPNWNPDADVNGDGRVDGRDMAIVLKAYGTHCDPYWDPRADLNGDWFINEIDFNVVEINFGYGV